MSIKELLTAKIASDPELKRLVSEIETSPATTKGHYDRYTNILIGFNRHGTVMVCLVADALKKAGANEFGVDSAVRIITH